FISAISSQQTIRTNDTESNGLYCRPAGTVCKGKLSGEAEKRLSQSKGPVESGPICSKLRNFETKSPHPCGINSAFPSPTRQTVAASSVWFAFRGKGEKQVV